MMSLHHLKTFCTLVEEGSFTRTAERLYLSQPSVSQHIANLENEYDVTLFNRRGRTLSLTPEGNALYTLAIDVLEKANAIPQRFRDMQAMRYGKLDLGVSTYVGTKIVPTIVAEFNSKYPNVAMSIQTGNDPDIQDLLLSGDIEMAILEGDARTFKDKDLNTFVIGKDHMVLITSPDHPWTRRQNIAPQELNDEKLVLYESQCSLCPFVQTYLSEKRIDKYKGIFVNSREVAKSFVKSKVGVALINRGTVEEEIARGELRAIELKDLDSVKLDVVCFYKRSTGLGFACWAFRRLLENMTSKLG